jgi:hypothetical protein
MNDESALVPAEQKEVQFYGDELTAARIGDDIFVSVRHLCDALGLDRASQARRMRRDEILADGYEGSVMMTSPGGSQATGMLRADLVPLWLAKVDISRVREEIKPKLRQYQKEVVKVLWEAFQEGRLTAEPSFDELLRADTPAAQAYKMARALMEMARQQLILEARLNDHTARLSAHDDRLEQIEATLGDRGRFITPEQAGSISQSVKAIAMTLSKKSGRNEYGAVYGEFYRKFGIPSYRELPARRFDEAARFLADWYQRLTGEGLPF